MDTASLQSRAHAAPDVPRTYREHGHWRDRTHFDDLRVRAARDPDAVVLVDRCGGDRLRERWES